MGIDLLRSTVINVWGLASPLVFALIVLAALAFVAWSEWRWRKDERPRPRAPSS